MATIDLASNSALLSVAEKLAEQNQLLSSIAVRGKSAFIRYSAYNDGTDFTETWSAGQNYIGHAVDFEAPTDKSAYTWSLFASNIRETLTITLPANAWSNNAQTFETLMIGENSTVFPTPTPECKDDYLSAGVMISAATATSLVFTCVNTPATDITVTVYITEPATVVGGADSGLGQSDWAAGEGEPGEILNKPFGDIMLYTFNSRDEFLNGQDVATQLVAGETYTVVFDGVSYTCVAKDYDDCVRLGNNDIYEGVETTKTEPFAIEQSGTTISGYLAADDTAEHTVQIIFTKTIDPKYSGASWDALVGKPFYEGTVDLGETITWDGVLDDSATKLELPGVPDGYTYDMFIKHISDSVPTMEELQTYSATMYTYSGGKENIQNWNYENNPLAEYDGCIAGTDGIGFFIATKENVLFSMDGLEVPLPKPGIYALYMNLDTGSNSMQGYTQEFSIPGYNFQMHGIQKLDPKFVHTPDWKAQAGEPGEILNRPFGEVVEKLGDTVTWDGTHDENTIEHFNAIVNTDLRGIIRTQYISSNVPTVEEIQTGSIVVVDDYNGDIITETITLDTADIWETNGVIDGYFPSGSNQNGVIPIVVATKENAVWTEGPETIVLPKKGIYLLEVCTEAPDESTRLSVSEFTIPGYNFEMTGLKKLDPKYVYTPDWNAGTGTGGEILNRPFYDYTQEFGDTVTWDGAEKSEDDIVIDLGSIKEHIHYLASNVPTIEELETGTVVYVDNGETYTVSIANDINTSSNGTITFGNGLFQVVHEDNLGNIPLKKGIWCIYNGSGNGNIDYGKSLTIPGYNFYLDQFKKIDPKFIDTPDWDAIENQAGYIKNRPFGTTIGTGDTLHKDIGYSESVEVEGGLLKLYHMCDNVPTAEELVGSTVTMRAKGESVVVELTEEMISVSENGVISVQADELPVLLIAPDDISEPMGDVLLTLKKGVHFVDIFLGMAVTESLQIPGYEFPAISIQKIDMQYLPFGSQGVTVEWDGVLEGKETIEYTTNDKDYVLVKLTDRAFTEEELASAIVTYADQTTGSLTELESMLETAYNTVLDSNGNYGFHRLQLLSSPSKLTNAGYYGFFELEATGTYVTYNADLSLPEIIKLEVPNAYQTIDEKYLPNNYVTRAMFDDEVAQRRALENVIGYNGTWTGLTLVDALSEAFATKDELQEAQMATQDMLNAFESHLGFVTTGLEEQTVAEVINDTFATKEELIAATESKVTATVGQTIVVKAVDENGKPTEWEAVDMPTFELVSPNGTRYNLAVADDGTLSAVAIVEEPTDPVEPEEPTDPVEPEPEEPTDPEVDPTEPTGDATEE